MTANEERALRSDGNGPVPWSNLQTEFVERTPGKTASADSSTKDSIEAVRLCAFSPPGFVVSSAERQLGLIVLGQISRLTSCLAPTHPDLLRRYSHFIKIHQFARGDQYFDPQLGLVQLQVAIGGQSHASLVKREGLFKGQVAHF